MKKKGIIIASAAVLIAGAAFIFKGAITDSVGNQFEKQAKTFLEENKNKPISIRSLTNSPEITSATITINEVGETEIKSQFDISLAMGEQFSIPLTTEIQRGEVSHNGKDYGFGKLVTRPDLSGFKDLPPVIDNNTFTLEQFIDLLGNVHEIYSIQPLSFKDDGQQLNFAGLTANVDTSFFNRQQFSGNIAIRKLTVDDRSQTLILSPINGNFSKQESGEYTVDVEGFSFEIAALDGTGGISVDSAATKGKITHVDTLDTPLHDSQSTLNGVVITIPNPVTGQMSNYTLDSLAFDVGMNQSDEQHVDITYGIKADAQSAGIAIPTLPIAVQSLSINTEILGLPNEAINTYISDFIPSLANAEDSVGRDEAKMILTNEFMPSLQQSDFRLQSMIELVTDQGTAVINSQGSLNEKGKSINFVDIESGMLSEDEYMTLVDLDINVTLPKSLVDATGLTDIMQLYVGPYIKENETDYTFEFLLQEGKTTLNGQEVQL